MATSKKVTSSCISEYNLIQYVKDTYGNASLTSKKIIGGITPLLQSHYGGDMDCTLTSITTILNNGNAVEVYKKVEQIAKKYFYNSNRGTNPLVIKCILDKMTNKKSKRGYLKNIGYSWSSIKTLIKANKPIILSMNNDGRNYYKNHSVTIVGYAEYNGGKVKMLAVYDNWSRSTRYIDYNKLSVISSINYI